MYATIAFILYVLAVTLIMVGLLYEDNDKEFYKLRIK